VIGLNQTDTAGNLAGQRVGNTGFANMEDAASPPGATNIDYYRHGKYPRINVDRFETKGSGKVAVNVLFADGHCSTLQGMAEGYKAIRMRYP
jgi:prepilin-type processing-associated H-X9-DG protein